MQSRLDYYAASPEALKAMLALEAAISLLSIDKPLLELVRLRASQLNGCAYCVDLHSINARNLGESERRLHGLAYWREAPFFNSREMAALAWTEAVTLLTSTRVPDEVFQQLQSEFSPQEMVDLTLSINTINSWNRLAVSFRHGPTA